MLVLRVNCSCACVRCAWCVFSNMCSVMHPVSIKFNLPHTQHKTQKTRTSTLQTPNTTTTTTQHLSKKQRNTTTSNLSKSILFFVT